MMKKKALTMTALACTFVLGSWAQNPEPQSPQFKYIERSWDDSQKQIVETEKTLTGSDYTMLSGSDDWVRLGVPENPTEEQINKDYYYAVAGIVSYKVLNVYGRVHLILCNNAQLTCTGSVLVEDGHNNAKLFIYGQKDVEGQNPGKLIVNNTEYNSTAGIGSSEEQKCGEIIIHGGDLDVKGSKWAAGIGGGGFRVSVHWDASWDFWIAADGTTTIYGGTVRAQGGELGAGIGAGGMAKGGTLTIYGGDVTATGGELAAGVGGGGSYQRWTSNTNGLRGGLGSNVYVYGGKLTAQGGQYAAGIGTGCIADGEDTQNKVPETDRGELYVYEGATVIATGGNWGAGIGGGWKANGIKTWIYGGNVTAKGGEDAAGIGSGENTKYSEEYEWRAARGGETHISGGVVRAEGTSYSAGIGGGEYGFGGKTYITGGTVTVVAGEDCECRNNGGGCAIGCGQGIGDDGNNKDTERNAGILEIGDNMKVTGGDAENINIEAFSTAVRVPACIWRNYVKIEPCTHTVPDDGTTTDVYIYIDEGSHYRYCRYCKNIITEEHTAGECPCGSKGYSFTTYVPVANPTTAGTGYQEVRAYRLKAGKYFFLPECDVIPTGYKFLGWEMNPNPESASYDKWAAVKGGDPSGDDKIAAGTSVQALEGMDNAKFYARYLYDFNDEWTWGEGNTSGSLKISCEVLDDIYVQFQESDITKQYLDDGIEYSISYTYTLNGYNYIFSTQKTAPYKLTLQDAADNNTAIGQYNGKTATATLAGRTLYRDGKWNTLCLPFALSLDAKNSPLSGDDVEAMVLRSSDSGLNGTTLTLNFEAVSPSGEQGGLIPAGTPFIIKWGTVDSHPDTDLTDPVFQDVTVSDATNDVSFTGGVFKGTYEKITYTTEKKSILFLGDDNTLYYPQPSDDNIPSIGACRAYFELSGTGAREFKLYFGDVGSADDSSASGIAVVSFATDADGDVRAPRWYDLQGRQIVNSKFVNRKLFKGLYINNGKKVVIK